MRFLAIWASARLVAGVWFALVVEGSLQPPLPIPQAFKYPLGITAAYLLLIEFMAFLVQPSGIRLYQLRARYWDPMVLGLNERFRCRVAAASSVKIEFADQASKTMTRVADRGAWWYAGVRLDDGEYRYRYLISGADGRTSWQLDDTDPKVGEAGQERSLRRVSDVTDLPKMRVQNRTSIIQILTTVTGIMAALSGRSGAPKPTYPLSLTFLLSGVVLGVLYMLVLNGGIREDKSEGGRAIISASKFHEALLEVILNLEVIALLLGSSTFFE